MCVCVCPSNASWKSPDDHLRIAARARCVASCHQFGWSCWHQIRYQRLVVCRYHPGTGSPNYNPVGPLSSSSTPLWTSWQQGLRSRILAAFLLLKDVSLGCFGGPGSDVHSLEYAGCVYRSLTRIVSQLFTTNSWNFKKSRSSQRWCSRVNKVWWLSGWGAIPPKL